MASFPRPFPSRASITFNAREMAQRAWLPVSNLFQTNTHRWMESLSCLPFKIGSGICRVTSRSTVLPAEKCENGALDAREITRDWTTAPTILYLDTANSVRMTIDNSLDGRVFERKQTRYVVHLAREGSVGQAEAGTESIHTPSKQKCCSPSPVFLPQLASHLLVRQ